MSTRKTIQSALISVFDKTGLEPIVRQLHKQNAIIYSTGGTEDFIKNLDFREKENIWNIEIRDFFV